MILYLHGFGSSASTSKVIALREAFGDQLIAPNMPFHPEEAITMCCKIIKEHEGNIVVAGSSLGGFYAWLLGTKFNIHSLCVNPLTYPASGLSNRVNVPVFDFASQNFQTLTQGDIDFLVMAEQVTRTEFKPELMHLFVSLDDEVLDARRVLAEIPASASRVITEDGLHSFERHWTYFIQKLAEVHEAVL